MKTFTILILILGNALMAGAQGVLRYNFNNTLTETTGTGPVLSVLGNPGIFKTDTLNEISGKTKTVYRFEANSGFQFNNQAAGNFLGETYTIELYFKFDNLNSWKRVIDWKNRKTDKGAYVFNGQLNFYNYVYSPVAPVVAGEYTYYVVSRDSVTGNIRIYTDAEVMISFTDSQGDGVIDSDHVLNFFHDDVVVPNEASSGAVALLNLYNYVLDSTVIRQNWENIGSQVSATGKDRREVSTRIRPNPVAGLGFLDLSEFRHEKEVQILITDIMGRVVEERLVSPVPVTESPLDVTRWPEGLYTVKTQSGGKISFCKMLVKRDGR